jgi:hypothetical protein
MARRDPVQVKQNSIISAVRAEVERDFSAQDALARGYANINALARVLAPRVRRKMGRKVNVVSVVTSLKRIRGSYSESTQGMHRIIAGSVVNVRTNVSKLSVEKTRKTLRVVGTMLSNHQEDFIQVSESLSSITLIFDQKLHSKIGGEFYGAEVLEEGDEYAAITVQSPEEIISTPGCVISFYNQLLRRKVNIEDTVSCYTDTIIVVKMSDAGRAFDALSEMISEERRRRE